MQLFALFFPVFALALQNCRIPDNLGQGYIVNVYLQPVDTAVVDENFLLSLDNYSPSQTLKGVTNLNFNLANTNPNSSPWSPYNPYQAYGGTLIKQESFNLQMYGYFLPPKTDDYTFTLTAADDMAIIRLGDGIAFPCCGDMSDSAQEATMFGSKTPTAGVQGQLTGTFFIPGGYSIPIKISYAQREKTDNGGMCNGVPCVNPAGFGLTITDGKGNDVSNQVFYLLDESQSYCPPVPMTSTSVWSGPGTVFTTSTSIKTVTITTGSIVYTTSSVIVNILPDTVTKVETEVLSEVQTVTVTETVTSDIETCSAPDTLTVTESVTVTKSVTVDLGTDSVLTIYTSGTTEGTTTTLSCVSDEL